MEITCNTFFDGSYGIFINDTEHLLPHDTFQPNNRFYETYYDIYAASGSAFDYAVSDVVALYQPDNVVNTQIHVNPGLKVRCSPRTWKKPKNNSQDETTGLVENLSHDLISIYPNPTSQVLTINWTPEKGDEHLQVFDPSGKLVYSEQFINNTTVTLDVSQWTAGLYFVSIQSRDQLKTSKFVVQ